MQFTALSIGIQILKLLMVSMVLKRHRAVTNVAHQCVADPVEAYINLACVLDLRSDFMGAVQQCFAVKNGAQSTVLEGRVR